MCFVRNALFPIGSWIVFKIITFTFQKQETNVYGLCFTKHLFEKTSFDIFYLLQPFEVQITWPYTCFVGLPDTTIDVGLFGEVTFQDLTELFFL